MHVLVTGATGYIGGRLVPTLVEAGHDVRCLARDPNKLQDRWWDQVEVVRGDVLDPATLGPALAGCEAAYYLVHSMGDRDRDFHDLDREAARNFRDAATKARLGRIVYLGGLGRGDDLSRHLASRQEVGQVLASGPIPVTEVRAAVIIGSASISFEMMRYLTEVLPVMITPKWVRTRCQPIAIRNVLEILVAALDSPDKGDHVWEVGGPDQLTYEEMMRIYADEAGLPRRLIIPVPLLSPQLSRHWIGLVTPLPTEVAKPLVNSLRNEVTVADNSVAEGLTTDLMPFREAVRRALQRPTYAHVAARCTDAAASPAAAQPSDPDWAGGTVKVDDQRVRTFASPEDLYSAFARIGGNVGYYGVDWMWSLRGMLDKAVGGVGLRRGRRHTEELHDGDTLDFWRVSAVQPGRRLLLKSEMKLPGDLWLEFEARPDEDRTELRQTTYFLPRGLLGRLYWLVILPLHLLVFKTMARGIAKSAEKRNPPSPTQPTV